MFNTRHRPLLLRLGDRPGFTPIRIFLVLGTITGALSFYFDSPLISPLTGVYAISICIYLTSKHQRVFEKLQPLLDIDEEQYQQHKACLTQYNSVAIVSAAALVIPVFFIVNWNSGNYRGILAGDIAPRLADVWAISIALLSWACILQNMVIIFSNMLRFNRLAKHNSRVNLMDIKALVPFTQVGISTILLFSGPYSLFPWTIYDSIDLLVPLLISAAIVTPVAVAYLLLPLLGVRNRIRKVKRREIELVSQALKGNRDALKDTLLANEANTISTANLTLYKNKIEHVTEWPFDNSALVRIFSYVIVPVIAWVGDIATEQAIEEFLNYFQTV
ncbi:MAG: hypothetical protein KJN90_04780 [Gammaproteobacteria bacterium]|nr:hypothetical protein [Gammaproteobacteria bacterium]